MREFLDIEECVPVGALSEFFEPDFDAGVLRWREREVTDHRLKSWNKRFAGKIAGRLNTAGHVQIIVLFEGQRYSSVAHRVLWAMRNGNWPGRHIQIDHKEHDLSDNSTAATRSSTPSQNCQNKRLYHNNTSGFKGVSFYKPSGRWVVKICVEKQMMHLGTFDDPSEGARVYDEAANRYFGEFALTNAKLGLLP